MEQNANAILTLCSHLCMGENIIPLEPKEWSTLAQKLIRIGKTPGDLFSFSEADYIDLLALSPEEAQRMQRLVDRSPSLSFELERYESMGIRAVTRADITLYPSALRKKLGNGCPPIFYCAGDLALLKNRTIGYVGSRSIGTEDLEFTKNAVRNTAARGYGVVSGGAKGIDTVAGTEALLQGSFSIEYLSDSMLKKLKSSDVVRAVQDGRLLMLSVAKPDAGFNVGIAMMRNRYIYAQSEATVVVRSDLNKGGTWTGATENLRHNWAPTLCRDCSSPGNHALIQKGAIPIPETWDGTIPDTQNTPAPTAEEPPEQISMFD